MIGKDEAIKSRENAFSSGGELRTCFPVAVLSSVYHQLLSEGGRPFLTLSHGLAACAAASIVAQIWRFAKRKPIDSVANNALRVVLESYGVQVKFVSEANGTFEGLSLKNFGSHTLRIRIGSTMATLQPKLPKKFDKILLMDFGFRRDENSRKLNVYELGYILTDNMSWKILAAENFIVSTKNRVTNTETFECSTYDKVLLKLKSYNEANPCIRFVRA